MKEHAIRGKDYGGFAKCVVKKSFRIRSFLTETSHSFTRNASPSCNTDVVVCFYRSVQFQGAVHSREGYADMSSFSAAQLNHPPSDARSRFCTGTFLSSYF